MYSFFRGILFLFQPERAHYITANFLHVILKIPGIKFLWKTFYTVKHPSLERKVFGLNFPNPVGLAAGFDKDAKIYTDLFSCGFGFIEIGTVTPKSQPGNPLPRLFRLKEDQAIINRMGFNNGGVDVCYDRLKNRERNLIVGGNIGKNKWTENEDAVNDYLICFNTLFEVVDYFVVNVSSPNTPGLRDLQEKEPLLKLLSTLSEENRKKQTPKPILLKIAPDLTDGQLDDIIDIIKVSGIDGVIATNTTISREGLMMDKVKLENIGAGGLSGKPLTKRSTEVIRYLTSKSNNAFPVIGVGGIHSVEDAHEKLNAGASLIQLYTGFIYEGPSLIKRINKSLIK
ncbi:MAG: quinone-dependent dihydroorotate dehydrogenase [Crocinitomicaceae bacterium]|jgi:dihydroorotate dehydrogenase